MDSDFCFLIDSKRRKIIIFWDLIMILMQNHLIKLFIYKKKLPIEYEVIRESMSINSLNIILKMMDYSKVYV